MGDNRKNYIHNFRAISRQNSEQLGSYLEDFKRMDDEIRASSQKKKQELNEMQQEQVEQQPVQQRPTQKQYDTSAFDNAIMPQLMDPNFSKWANDEQQRQEKLNKQQANLPANKANKSQIDSFFKLQEQNKKEKEAPLNGQSNSILKRYSRIAMSQAIGAKNVSQDNAIQDDDIAEWNAYRAIKNPDYMKAMLEQADYLNKQQAKDNQAVNKPDDYISKTSLSNILYGTLSANPVQQLIGYSGMLMSQYGKDLFSTFIEKTNQSQAEKESGKIARAEEFKGIANKANQWVELTEKYAQNKYQIQLLQQQLGSANAQQRQSINDKIGDILQQNKEIRGQLENGKLWNDVNNLASWESKSTLGGIAQQIDNLIDDDLGGIRRKLNGVSGLVDRVGSMMQQTDYNGKWLADVQASLQGIKNRIGGFNEEASKKQQYWQNQQMIDVKDLNDWKSGENILGIKTGTSDWYKYQEQLLQAKNYNWSNPINTAMYGWAGIAGGSNASWDKSLISMGASIAAAMFTGPGGKLLSAGAKGAANLALTGIAFEANKTAGSDENNIEAQNRVKQGLLDNLRANGRYDEFIKEGELRMSKNKEFAKLKKNLNKDDYEDQLVDAYISGMWLSADPKVTKALANSMVGSNNLFYNDQPVNTADAAIDATLSTMRIAPIKQLANMAKVEGRLLRRALRKTAFGGAALGKLESSGLKFAGIKTGLQGAARKLAENSAVNAVRSVGTKVADFIQIPRMAAKELYMGVERPIADKLIAIREFATRVPSKYLKAKSIAKAGLDITGRIAGETASEMIQEGIQGFNSYKDIDNPTPYDEQQNRNMMLRIYDDILTGAKAAKYWLLQGDPAYHTDADVVGSMNATPLLTIFGPSGIQVGVRAKDTMHELNAADVIKNNIDIEKRGARASIEQAINYAKYAGKNDFPVMQKQFERYFKLAQTRENDLKYLHGQDYTQNEEYESNPNEIPAQLIRDQWQEYKHVAQLANSESTKALAAASKINTNTDKYNKFVALLNYRVGRLVEAEDKLNEVDGEIKSIFGNDIIDHIEQKKDREGEEESKQQTLSRTSEDITKSLLNLHALYKTVEDYKSLPQTKENTILIKNLESKIKNIQEKLKEDKIDVNNAEDVLDVINTGDGLQNLSQLLQFAQRQSNPEEVQNLSTRELVEEAGKYIRERTLKEYDLTRERNLYSLFTVNPHNDIAAYDKAMKSDEKLQETLERDFVDSVYETAEAMERTVKDGELYIGQDGLWYKAKVDKDKDGNIRIGKQRYHVNKRQTDETVLPFDPIEYHRAKSAVEEVQKEAKRRRNAEKTLNEVEDVETKTKHQSEEEPAKKQYSKPLTVQNEPFQYNIGETFQTKQGVYTVTDRQIVLNNYGALVPQYTAHAVYNDGSSTTAVTNMAKVEKDAIAYQKEQNDRTKRGSVQANTSQRAVQEKLLQKQQEDSKQVVKKQNGNKLTTSTNYFIEEDGKVVPYKRVHSVLPEMFEQNDDENKELQAVVDKLNAAKNEGKEQLRKTISELQQEYNHKVEEQLGNDKDLVDRYKVDLSIYQTDDVLSDDNTIDAVTHIVTNEIPGPAVIAGQILDDIAREYFQAQDGVKLENKPEYKMSDELFSNIIEQLNKLNKQFVDMGWIIDTTPYTWRGTTNNGDKIAGETDVIAIDKNGNIHILDFKTTKNSTRFKLRNLLRGTNKVTGETTWVPVADDYKAKEGEVVQRGYTFVLDEHPGGAARSYAAQYGMQLNTYKHMIQQQLGTHVQSLQIIPITIDYRSTKHDVQNMLHVNVEPLIDLTSIPEIRKSIDHIDSMFEVVKPKITDVKASKFLIQVQLDSYNKFITENQKYYDANKAKIDAIVEKLKQNLDAVENAIQNYNKLNTTELSQLLQNMTDYVVESDNLLSDFKKESQTYVTTTTNTNNTNKDISAESELEEVTEEDSKFWYQFNNLYSEAVKKLPGYTEMVQRPDFLINSEMRVFIDDRGFMNVEIIYTPQDGGKSMHFPAITVRIGNEAKEASQRNAAINPGNESVMGRNLLRQYQRLKKTLGPNEYIVVKGATRTNGKLVITEETRPITETPFFDLNSDILYQLNNGEESLIGVVDRNERVFEPFTGQRNTIYADAQQSKNYPELPGNFEFSWYPGGTVVFLHKFKNDEDDVDSEPRVVPIMLRGRTLSNNDIDLILDIISQPSTIGDLMEVVVVENDNKRRTTTIPGFTRKKALSLLTRFGKQASNADHEFVFQYADKDSLPDAANGLYILITDLTQEGEVQYTGGKYQMHRPKAILDLTNPDDVQRLRSILSLQQIHINQVGIMSSQLNSTTTEGTFGAMGSFILDAANKNVKNIIVNDTIQFTPDDIIPDVNYLNKSLNGIGWQIKHRIAITGAKKLENPLISIHELDKVSKAQKEAQHKEQQKIVEDNQINNTETIQNVDSQTQDIPEGEVSDAEINALLNFGGDVFQDFGMNSKATLRSVKLTEKEKSVALKNIRRLLGNANAEYLDNVTMAMRIGAGISGRMTADAIYLNDHMAEGTEYHEAFHRILELLTSDKRRQVTYDAYRQKYGARLSDRDVAEGLADLFADFMQNREHVKLHFNILRIFREIKQLVTSLHKLGSFGIAKMFMLTNSGLYRFIKPSQSNIERFANIFNGYANMKVTNTSGDKQVSVELSTFPGFGGRMLYNDAIRGIVYSVIKGYNIGDIANDASDIKIDRDAITNLFRGKETTTHSAWFRVLTGEYINAKQAISVQDALMYKQVFKNDQAIRNLSKKVILENKGKSPQDVYNILLNEIIAFIGSQTQETLSQSQKMMAELLSEKNWPVVKLSVNRQLENLGLVSRRRKEELAANRQDDTEDKPEEAEYISTEQFKETFYDHSRTDDASSAVRFLLSTIPDERFATYKDVEDGIVGDTIDANGNPVIITNDTNLLGYAQFLSMRTVSTQLLMKCHSASSAEELADMLDSYAKENPIFMRLSKIYRSYLDTSVIKHNSGKNKITVDGVEFPESEYAQHKDQNGVYYTLLEDGEDTGKRITNAVTLVDSSKEAFVTQMFNFVSSQRLGFIQVVLSNKKDENGNDIDDKYVARVQSSESDYVSTLYPKNWFISFRAGATDLFETDKNGRKVFATDGKQKLKYAISQIRSIAELYMKGVVQERGRIKKLQRSDKQVEEDIFKLTTALNTLGLNITPDVLKYHLREHFQVQQNNITLSDALSAMFTQSKKDLSFQAFDKQILAFLDDMNDDNVDTMLGVSAKQIVDKNGNVIQNTTGMSLYTNNAFVKWLAKGVGRYNKQFKEAMTVGANNTRRYTIAQSNSASEITKDINNTTVQDNVVTKGVIIRDAANYTYNFQLREVQTAAGTVKVPFGSMIIKNFFSKSPTQLTLYEHGGSKVEGDTSGGVGYQEMSRRTDFLSKAAIIQTGGIIFPTLSDKSTWFHLTGIKLPGLDYNSLASTSPQQLPKISWWPGQDFSINDLHLVFDDKSDIAQLDQMIEYAFCERDQIEKEIARKNVPNIKSWKNNRLRFGALSEIVRINENGKKEIIYFSDYDKSPEECLKLADQAFFGEHVSQSERRKIMALSLENGLEETIDNLINIGLVEKLEQVQPEVTKDGKATGKTIAAHKFLSLRNVGLNADVIEVLKQKYLQQLGITEPTQKQLEFAESKAVVAYLFDINNKSVMSNEEVERIYTGAPSFFKWKSGLVEDPITKKQVNTIIDRTSDQTKRLGGLGSTGEQNRPNIPNVGNTYRSAEVKDLIVTSKQKEYIISAFIENQIRDAFVNSEIEGLTKRERYKLAYSTKISLDEIKKYIGEDVYAIAEAVGRSKAESITNKINVADGAAYITPAMTEKLLRQRGVFTDKIQKAFEYLSGKKQNGKYINPLNNNEAYKLIVDALIGAQKYTAYGYRTLPGENGDIMIHYYDKFALFPIFETMATGFTQKLLRKMQAENIDMLKMDSAVKTGSQDAVECNPADLEFDEAFDNFQLKPYEQQFKFLRRQLNTDPHEHNEATVGTQMTKIALSNLNHSSMYYYKSKNISGNVLLTQVMDNINALSNIGEQQLREQMFNEDGTLNIQKFSQFLREELESRDADENLLDGIEVVEVDGKLDFKIPLEAMSSIDWIESILVSKINKKVIDIQTNGNAFYQRPVWGMEGNPTVLTDEDLSFQTQKLNNGEELKLVNNDGSMDAIISIDFFSDIIPHSIRNNFKKSRQWLLNNKIIGNTEDVVANTISARIPTQAQSSISPLRFVDVLPVVRSTIVLPAEFTALTGSDFDIDKLYLTRLSYRIQKEEKDGKTTQYLTSEFKQEDGSIYHQNELINLYLTLLKRHGKEQSDGNITIGDSVATNLGSVDKDTKLITDVLDEIESDVSPARNYAYRFGNLTVQALIHQDLLGGKFGIGPFALNNNNQVLTQLYKVGFNTNNTTILTNLGITELYNPKDKDGNYKLSWLSGFINANVDVAKDPYIARLNVNKFTYNLVNLLIRGGMGARTLYFTTQPVMIEMAKAFNDAEDAFMGEFNQTPSQRQRNAVQKIIYDITKSSSFGKNFTKTLMDNSTISELFLSQIARQLFGTSNDTHSNLEDSILYKIMKNKNVRKNTNNAVSLDNLDGGIQNIEITIDNDLLAQQLVDFSNTSGATVEKMIGAIAKFYKNLGINAQVYGTHTINISALDTQLLVALVNNQFSKYGNALADLVAACKIDTKKYGKSYVEQQAFLDKYDSVFDDEFDYFNEGLQKLNEDSYIQTKVDNAINLYTDIISNISLQTNSIFNMAVSLTLDVVGGDIKDVRLVRKINRAIMTVLKQRFFNNYMSEKQRNELLFGDNTVQDNLIRIINKLKSAKQSELNQYVRGGVVVNKLLAQLSADHYNADENFDTAKFVILENTMSDDSIDINEITRAWDDLFQDTENYITLSDGSKKTFRQFAIDLAVYAFITSGDTNGQTKFFKYVPNTIKQHIGYSDYIRNLNTEIEDFNVVDIVDSVISANWNDEKFVKTVSPVKYINNTPISMLKQGIVVSRPVKKKFTDSNGITHEIEQSVKIPLKFAAINSKGEPTIKRNSDGRFPPYVKMKRAASTRFESDHMLLYKLDTELDINVEGGVAVYKLALPEMSTVRAGSYSYDVYGMNKTNDLAYPSYVREALNSIGFKFIQGSNPQEVLINFVDEIRRLNIDFETQMQLQQQLELEFADFGYNSEEERWQSYMQQAINWVQQQLGQNVKPAKPTQRQVTQQVESNVNSTNNTYINHSGGAVGSDSYWGEIGYKYGVKSNHYYHGVKTPHGNVEITQQQFEEGKQHVMKANQTLHRRPEKYLSLLSRNYQQVRNSDAIFAIGTLKNGIVDGGTGWAVQMAIDDNKPVFVYDQVRKQWYTNQNGKWSILNETPTLTKNFAGIGTRQLNEFGKRAIRDVYVKTFGDKVENADDTTTNKKHEVQVQGELFDDSEFEKDDMEHCKGMKPKSK